MTGRCQTAQLFNLLWYVLAGVHMITIRILEKLDIVPKQCISSDNDCYATYTV